MGPRPSKFSPRTPERTLRRPICSPGSSPRIPVSSQVSGRPRRASWPRTARRVPSHPPAPPPLDLEAFCGGPNTLYVCSTGRRQRQFAPLVVAIIGDVRDAAYARSRDGHTGPPTLLALDEVANIAPIPDLPAMVSEGAGQGLLVLACLQDLSQARVRWGTAADGFLSLFGTTVVLRGIADTADAARHQRAGRRPRGAPRRRSADRWTAGAASAPRRRSAAPVRPASRSTPWPTAQPGRALVLGPGQGRSPRSSLTPAHACSPWRELLPPAPRSSPVRRAGRPRPLTSAPEARARPSRARAIRAGPVPTSTSPLGADVVGQAVGRQRGQVRRVRSHRVAPAACAEAPPLPVGVERAAAPSHTAWSSGSTGRGPSARRWWFAGTTVAALVERLGHADRPGRHPLGDEPFDAPAASAPSRAAAPKAATTSRRWAPPWAGGRSPRRSGARRAPAGPPPGAGSELELEVAADRRGPAAASGPRARRTARPAPWPDGWPPRRRGRHGPSGHPVSCMWRRMSAPAARELAQQLRARPRRPPRERPGPPVQRTPSAAASPARRCAS